MFLVHRRELVEQIRQTFIQNNVDIDLVHFGMVQTVVNRIKRDDIETPSLIITDESHHALANSYRKIYDYFKDVPKIGFTATPVRLNGSGLGDVNDKIIEGPKVQWLIENKRLAPFKYYAPNDLDRSKLKMNSIREFSNASISNAMERKIYGNAVKHYEKLADGEQAIAYCHNIESSIRTAEEFNSHGIPAAHIDAKTPKAERDAIIDRFRRGEIKVLSNVEIIGEGFDVPDCSTVILLRPTKSLSLYIQMAMRGMRYRPNKTAIIIDHVNNVEEHGLPNYPHEWSLNVKKNKSTKENMVIVKTCKECLYTWEAKGNSNKCPNCGHIEEVETKEIDIDETAELKELNTAITLDFREPEDCKNMKELHELAKNKNYKSGWVYIQAKRMGWIR